jgi:hypothetical protein
VGKEQRFYMLVGEGGGALRQSKEESPTLHGKGKDNQ